MRIAMNSFTTDYKHIYPVGWLYAWVIRILGTEVYDWADGTKSYYFCGKVFIL